ncbi:M23 family metallopeptidase [Gephyromycinifex aptenodytis]|uniref:M23 family metallopeptidase n=1 Tax=Gephyromycinifex aptenodytis TaxID=2716227 RepID=UPI0014487E92|nr:M23 family metallopeptidase [Gephyromycinifex aptenodytis]
MFPVELTFAFTMLSAASVVGGAAPLAPGPAPPPAVSAPGPSGAGWVAPVPVHVQREFAPPSQRWLSGHRGVDLSAPIGAPVLAASDGVVIFAGTLAGRGVVSVEYRSAAGAIYRSSVEPVQPAVRTGHRVRAGERLGVSTRSEHCESPCLHWGVRRDGAYLNPLDLLGGPRRVRLFPVLVPAPAG